MCGLYVMSTCCFSDFSLIFFSFLFPRVDVAQSSLIALSGSLAGYVVDLTPRGDRMHLGVWEVTSSLSSVPTSPRSWATEGSDWSVMDVLGTETDVGERERVVLVRVVLVSARACVCVRCVAITTLTRLCPSVHRTCTCNITIAQGIIHPNSLWSLQPTWVGQRRETCGG
jgi:hypothetical protein